MNQLQRDIAQLQRQVYSSGGGSAGAVYAPSAGTGSSSCSPTIFTKPPSGIAPMQYSIPFRSFFTSGGGESIETAAGDPAKAGQSVREVGTNPFIVGDAAVDEHPVDAVGSAVGRGTEHERVGSAAEQRHHRGRGRLVQQRHRVRVCRIRP